MANRQHNERVLQNLQRGDIIRFRRLHGAYYHYGIYAGDNMVVHRGVAGPNIMDRLPLTSALSPSGVINNKAVIREDDFWDIVQAGMADIDNMFDEWTRPYPPEAVVSRARSKLGQEGYNLVTDNCEHFVTWCRYGFTTSEQVEVVKKKLEEMLENNRMTESQRDYILSNLALLSFPTKQWHEEEPETSYYPKHDFTRKTRRMRKRANIKSKISAGVHKRIGTTYNSNQTCPAVSNKASLWYDKSNGMIAHNSAGDKCFAGRASEFISHIGTPAGTLMLSSAGAHFGMGKGSTSPNAIGHEDEPRTEGNRGGGSDRSKVPLSRPIQATMEGRTGEEKTEVDMEGGTREDQTEANTDGSTREDQREANMEGGTREDQTKANMEGDTREDQTKANMEGGTREDQTKANMEGDTREDQTKVNTEGGTREDQTKANMEGGTRENQTKANMEGDTREDQTKANMEGDTREDQTKANMEGGTRKDQTKANMEGDTREDQTKANMEGGTRENQTKANMEGDTREDQTKANTEGGTREDQTEPPQVQEVNGESFENVTDTYRNEAPRNSAADNCFVFKTSRLISYYVRRVGAKLGLTKENPYPTAVVHCPQNKDDASSEKDKGKQESAQDGNRKNLETMAVFSNKEDAKQHASETYQSSPHTSQPEAALVETAEDEYCPLSDNPQNRKRLEQRGENKTAKPFEDGRKDRAVDKNEISAPLSKSNIASDQVACEVEDAFQERGAASAEKDCLKESKLQEQATPFDDLLRPKETRQSLAPDQNQSHSRVNGTTGMSWDREYFDSRERHTLPSIVDASRNNVEKSSNSTTSIRSNGTTGMSWHREHAEPREIPDILPSIVDTSVNANSIDSTSHNTRRVPVFQRYLSVDATSGRFAKVVVRVRLFKETAGNHGMSITNGSSTVAERLEQIGDHGGQHTGQGSARVDTSRAERGNATWDSSYGRQEYAPSGSPYNRKENGTAGSSFGGQGNGTGGSSFGGQGNGTAGSSFSGQGNGTGGSSFSGQRNGTGGSSFSGQRNGTAGSSFGGQRNGTGGSSFSGQGNGTGGSSFSGQGYGTAGSSFSGQGNGTAGSSFSGQGYGTGGSSVSGQGNGTGGSSSSGQGNGTAGSPFTTRLGNLTSGWSVSGGQGSYGQWFPGVWPPM